jgi:hypothetical protein
MYYIKKIKLKENSCKNYAVEENYKKLISENKKIDLFFKILVIGLFFATVSILLFVGDLLLKFAPLEFWLISFIFCCLILLYFINK